MHTYARPDQAIKAVSNRPEPSTRAAAGTGTTTTANTANQTANPGSETTKGVRTGTDGSPTVLAIQQATAKHRGLVPCAIACCTAIAIRLGATRVTVGWYDDKAGQCDALACSLGLPRRLTRDEKTSIGNAMLEAVMQQVTLSNVNPEGIRRIVVAQQALAGNGAAISMPLANAGEPIGAITLEFAQRQAEWVDTHIDELVDTLEQLVPVLSRLFWLEHQRSLSIGQRIRQTLVSRQQPGDSSRKRLWIIAASVFAAALLLVPFPQTINADARIEGAVQRVVVATSQGYLKTVNVRPGDRVRAGQLLATLGERDLELERDRLLGQVAQFRQDASTAIANGDRPAMAIARAQMEQAQAELALTSEQLAQTRVLAPIDGVVIDGDLWQATGTPVDRGQTLFTVAPADSWRVIVELPEQDIGRIGHGQQGELYLAALPWQGMDLIVERIAPVATIIASQNVFEVQAGLTSTPPDLRPGLRGTARLQTTASNLLSRWGRRLGSWFARQWWRWQPW